MSGTYTTTGTDSFTVTHARYLASKVIADLELCFEFYGSPARETLNNYQEELTVLLRGGYLKDYEFGFKKDGKRVVSWYYTVDSNGIHSSNERPGSIHRKANISGALYFNFVTYSPKWASLTQSEKDRVKKEIPIERTTSTAPSDGLGYWKVDKNYHSGGCSVGRKTFVPY